jgi:hypothetical protein
LQTRFKRKELFLGWQQLGLLPKTLLTRPVITMGHPSLAESSKVRYKQSGFYGGESINA